jgi:hypothetical protein
LFVKPVLETYNYDRAVRAAEAFGTQPVLRKDIPDRVTKTVPLSSFKDDNHAPYLVQERVQALKRWESQHFGRSSLSTDGSDPWEKEFIIVYVLVRKRFDWDRGTPAEAVDAVALLMETEAPDKLWIGEYVEEYEAAERARRAVNTWDPIIYAQYGDWHVEVARWD